jgi:hypothetical protein
VDGSEVGMVKFDAMGKMFPEVIAADDEIPQGRLNVSILEPAVAVAHCRRHDENWIGA